MAEDNDNVTPEEHDIIRDEKGRFVPGYSGNPGGKPAGTLDYKTRFKNEFIKYPMLKNGLLSDQDKFQHILETLSRLANDGNTFAIRMVLEYLMGKPIQTLLTKELDELKDIPEDELRKIYEKTDSDGTDPKESE